MKKGRIIIITGSPGTGKSTVGISAFLGFLFGGLTGQYILSIVVTAVILVVVLFALTQLTKLRYPEKVH